MAWSNDSRRRQELPPNWRQLRATVLLRDGHRCQIAGKKCTSRATEVDHAGDRHDHRLSQLRAACHPCHAERTQAQSRVTWRVRRYRPTEPPPGLIT